MPLSPALPWPLGHLCPGCSCGVCYITRTGITGSSSSCEAAVGEEKLRSWDQQLHLICPVGDGPPRGRPQPCLGWLGHGRVGTNGSQVVCHPKRGWVPPPVERLLLSLLVRKSPRWAGISCAGSRRAVGREGKGREGEKWRLWKVGRASGLTLVAQFILPWTTTNPFLLLSKRPEGVLGGAGRRPYWSHHPRYPGGHVASDHKPTLGKRWSTWFAF